MLIAPVNDDDIIFVVFSISTFFVLSPYQNLIAVAFHPHQGVRLASKFEEMVQSDPRFEVAAPRHLGLICFRLRGDNQLTEKLLKRLNSNGRIHCVPASLKVGDRRRTYFMVYKVYRWYRMMGPVCLWWFAV